jgi:hypothetical protein
MNLAERQKFLLAEKLENDAKSTRLKVEINAARASGALKKEFIPIRQLAGWELQLGELKVRSQEIQNELREIKQRQRQEWNTDLGEYLSG